MRAAALVLALLPASAAAQEAPVEMVPEAEATAPAENPVETSPEPAQRPQDLSGDVAEDPPETAEAEPVMDDAARPTAPGEGVRDRLALADADYDACLADLAAIGATFAPADPIVAEDDADCGVLRPVELSELLPGIAFDPPAPLRCPAALAAARWTRDFVLPAAARAGRGDLVAIDHGSTYVCRRRNGQPDGKPSEHSFGNAIDVMGFRFAEGDPIRIRPRERDGTLAEAFQDAVRASACLEFTTVLGPGSDAFHDDHLHLDVVGRDGGFRLCQ